MSALEYVHIPHCAKLMQENDARPKFVKTISKLPSFSDGYSTVSGPISPTKQSFNFPNFLLSSSLHLSNSPPTSPRDGVRLISTRESLSLQIMTVNFRRFVSKSGPIFWLQDRMEEIVMWKKGWKITCTWMAVYTFLCYFPRMFLLLPHVALISIILNTHGTWASQVGRDKPQALLTQQPKEGSIDWYANLQGIQNLMGAFSDVYDIVMPFLPTFLWLTPHTSQLLSLLFVSLLLLVPVVIFIPLRPIFLCLGLFPLILTHPRSSQITSTLIHRFSSTLRSRVQRLIENDNLAEQHWFADIQEVELWENERWTANAGWSKSNLGAGERKPWTKGRDGWSDVVLGGEGDFINLTLCLSHGYEFVETEGWRINYDGQRMETQADDSGWIYTSDSWMDPHAAPIEEWNTQGMTRQRLWRRRIYRKMKPEFSS